MPSYSSASLPSPEFELADGSTIKTSFRLVVLEQPSMFQPISIIECWTRSFWRHHADMGFVLAINQRAAVELQNARYLFLKWVFLNPNNSNWIGISCCMILIQNYMKSISRHQNLMVLKALNFFVLFIWTKICWVKTGIFMAVIIYP